MAKDMWMFVVARNPKPRTRLPYLLFVPVAGERPLVLATSDQWPAGRDLFCYQVQEEEWPEEADVVESVPVQSSWRAGKAVYLVLNRRQRRRCMFIWTESRGRTLIFWRTQQTIKSARPGIRVPAARGLETRPLSIAVDHRERYPWRFPRQHAQIERRELPVGDYGVFFGDSLVAVVERKSIPDLVSAISSGTLRMQLLELSRLPRAVLVVEGRLSDLMKAEKEAGISAGWLLNLSAALQAEYPNVQWIFAETRAIAQDVAYRWLSAAVAVLRSKWEGKSGPPVESAVAEDSVGWDLNLVDHSEKVNIEPHDVSRGHDVSRIHVRDRLGRRREALVLARQGHTWTIRSYQEHFRVSAATACQDLKELVQQGYLSAVGSRRRKQFIWTQESQSNGASQG